MTQQQRVRRIAAPFFFIAPFRELTDRLTVQILSTTSTSAGSHSTHLHSSFANHRAD